MKANIVSFLSICVLLYSGFSHANYIDRSGLTELNARIAAADLGLIDWKIGDAAEYKVDLGIGIQGTMKKEAFKEEGNAIWVKQELSLPIMNDKSETLIDRDSGKILKYIHNGKEEAVPNQELELISVKNDVVEVPAGKFHVQYIIAKTKDVKKLEVWTNPREISLDGTAKLIADQGQMKLSLELVKFTRK